MIYRPVSTTDFRLLLPETLWLEPEHFEQARQMSHSLDYEPQQWQDYIGALALLAFKAWLGERLSNHSVQQITKEVKNIFYLSVDEFKLGLIATEHVLNEVVYVPRCAVEPPDLSAHFYVLLEVLEEQEQVIVRGFMPHEELMAQANSIAALSSNDFYKLPLAAFDMELNHLIAYLQYLEPNAVSLQAVSAQLVEAPSSRNFNAFRTRLSQWLQGVLDEGWQTIDALMNLESNLAWNIRSKLPSSVKGGKLINFGVQFGNQTVAMLVTVTPEIEGKIGIHVQVLPTGEAQILPPQLKLTLLSSKDKVLQEVQSRDHDNLIQLKPFKGKPGTNFSIEVSLHDNKVREAFEL
jgi:hypothetical protein